MSDTGVIVLVVAVIVVVVVLVALAVAMSARRRRADLRDRYGAEYDRAVQDRGSRSEAERELADRQQRHDQLDIRTLLPEEQQRFTRQWGDAQALFVDNPTGALAQADTLVQTVMSARGYPTGDFDRQAADLSVEHSDVLNSYRAAHVVSEHTADGSATTEEMRQGMRQYRVLVAALLDDGRGEPAPEPPDGRADDGPREGQPPRS